MVAKNPLTSWGITTHLAHIMMEGWTSWMSKGCVRAGGIPKGCDFETQTQPHYAVVVAFVCCVGVFRHFLCNFVTLDRLIETNFCWRLGSFLSSYPNRTLCLSYPNSWLGYPEQEMGIKNNWLKHHIFMSVRKKVDPYKDIGMHSHCHIIIKALIRTGTGASIPVHETI